MSATTRRDLLTGATATLVGAFVALPQGAVALPADSAVAALLTAYRQAIAVLNQAETRADRLWFSAAEQFPERPDNLYVRFRYLSEPDDNEVKRRPLSEEDIETLYARLSTSVSDPQRGAQRVKRFADLRTYEAACNAVLAQHGYPAARAEADALEEKMRQIIREIAATPARTVADVRLKLLFADEIEDYREAIVETLDLVAPKMIMAAIADLGRLSGSGA